jgi:uncharacterized protein YidB (DUF937 family)
MSNHLFGQSGGIGGTVKMAALALLLQQLMKHAGGGARAGTAGQGDVASGGGLGGGMGGGLGGLLGGLLGGGATSGAAGGSMGGPMGGGAMAGGLGGLLTSVLGSLAGGSGGLLGGGAAGSGMGGGMGGSGGLGGLLGGLGGLLGNMRGQGLSQQVDSWMAPGPNQPVSPQDLEASFDPQELDEAARHAGTDRAGLLAELSTLLPEVVDRATPKGSLPQHEDELGQGGLAGLLQGVAGHPAPRG